MLRLYSEKRTRAIVDSYAGWIDEISRRYGIPGAYMKAVLRKEIAEIDLFDPMADLLVALFWLRFHLRQRLHRLGLCRAPALQSDGGLRNKHDSSTGFAQIFAFVAVNAVNYALDRGLDDPAGLGVPSGRRLDRSDPDDLYGVWRRLLRDRKFNLRLGILNLISAAEEMNGHTDFARYTPEEIQRTFTRYNADVRHITDYGREVYGYYLEYSTKDKT